MENIIKLFVSKIFQGYEITSADIIRITRDADFSLQEDDASDLLKEIESTIKRMHRRSVVKIEYEKGISPEILQFIAQKNSVQDEDLYEINGILNLRELMELYDKISREDLKYKPITPIYPSDFKNKDIFKVIDDNDRILFHPYHSYEPVVELLNKAANDPDVLAIKQTLYRTSSDSAIIKALIRAAENGKYVTVIDELKARFDEKRNIEWARKLEDAGAHVTYGVANLKTHAKAMVIIKKESGGLKRYIHLGTGNYNETTANQYTDFSLFTSEDSIGEDVSSLFNLLTGFSLSEKWNCLSIAPTNLRRRFLDLIQRETENARKGLKARITAKLNSIVDEEIIESLYEASSAGVKIQLIVRGICSLVPGVKGLSENISVVSIIGRYLEHSRIFIFHNAGDEEYYLSSADWMNRNLDRRIEILFPVQNEENKAFINRIVKIQFDDNINSWELLRTKKYYPNGNKEKQTEEKNSFQEIYQYIRKLEENRSKTKELSIKPIKSVEEF